MPKDFRTFLKDYEAKYPEDILHIEKEVSADQETTAIVAKLEKQDKYPVLYFHNVLTPEGKKTNHPVVTNVLASRTRYARICNSTFQTLGRDIAQATKTKKKTPLVISQKEAPVQEVIKTGDKINLYEFPALKHNALDAGLYFSSGFLITYDPDSGIDNCALQRGWILEKDVVRVQIAGTMHNGINLHKHNLRNQDMKVAYWLGHHPLGYIGGLAKLPYPGSHWEAMGGMLDEPLRVVPSATLGDDFLVPADAEVIVEGIVEANKVYPEGPFGEFPRYFGGQMLNPQFKVTAITHRKDAIWYDIVPGWADHQGTGGPALEGQLWDSLKPRFPALQNVYMPLSGTGRFHAYLQFKDPGPTDARQAIVTAVMLNPGLIKHAFAFNEDVDIFNEKEVMWAIATRSQWDKDVIIIPRTKVGSLDPSAGLAGENAASGLDCTIPWNESYEEKVYVEPEILNRVKLKDYISTEALAGVQIDRAQEED